MHTISLRIVTAVLLAALASGAQAQTRSLPPRGICCEEAAAYVGVSVTKFDQMVADGRMPQGKQIDGCKVWDVRKLDKAFDALPDENDAENLWSRVK